MPSSDHPFLMLADDNADDCALIERALKECAPEVIFASVGSGDALLAYLADAANRTPELILLDMMMPGLSGFDVLAERKRLPELLRVPVIALTITGDEDAVRRAYDLGASAYLTKPYEYAKLVSSVAALVGFYFGTAQLPGRKQGGAKEW